MPRQDYPNINMPSTGMGPIGRRFLQSQENQSNQFSVPPAMSQRNVGRFAQDQDLERLLGLSPEVQQQNVQPMMPGTSGVLDYGPDSGSDMDLEERTGQPVDLSGGDPDNDGDDHSIMAAFVRALLMRLMTPDTDTQAMNLFGGDGGPEPAEPQMFDQKRVPY